MARERRLFSEEFKREAVELVGQPGASKAGIARDLGLGALLANEASRLVDRAREGRPEDETYEFPTALAYLLYEVVDATAI
jgi:transposase-like protein